jgi:hypothetical protein
MKANSVVQNADPLICFKKSTLIRTGIIFVVLSALIIYGYHKYQKSKCQDFCIYHENFSNIKNKRKN